MLMSLLISSLKKELKLLLKNDIKLQTIGNINSLPQKVRNELNEVIKKTKNNTHLTLNLALSYSSKEEIVNAFKNISKKIVNNELQIEEIDEKIINNHLYTRNLPNVDLVIRTSGEMRISNFLLWQIAYAELYFTSIFWPDFRKDDFFKAILNYQQRERRFGKTSDQLKENDE
jgi:undecaprenyl diphosphate synthase